MANLTTPRTARAAQIGDGYERSPLGLYVPPKRKIRYDRPVAVDLFAGAGGFGMGFHQAGFHVAAASEIWVDAALTYMVNLARPGVKIHFDTPEREAEYISLLEKSLQIDEKSMRKKPRGLTAGATASFPGGMNLAGSGWIANQPPGHRGCEHFFAYDIKNLTGALILDALGLDVGDVAVVTGGPPCQGFSAAGKRNVMDPRNSLIFEFARLVCEIRPRTFVMENVPGLLSMTTPEGIPVIDAFCLAVEDGGYDEYDTLRRSLAGQPDARVGTRGAKAKKPSRPKKPKRGTTKPADGDLLDLLEESA